MDFNEINDARKVLGLGQRASIKEIKDAFRRKSLIYHPDKCREKDENICRDEFDKVKKAYEVLMEYCYSYRFSFKKEDVGKTKKELYNHMERFYKSDWFGNFEDV